MKWYRILTVTISLMSVFSMSVNGQRTVRSATPALAEWTILVFMNGDNDLEEFALLNFYQMARIGSSKDVNIIVQFDRIEKHDEGDGAWTQTLRFRVEKDMPPRVEYALEDLGEQNMGDQQVLEKFVSWGIQKFPAKRYMVDIWDHGQGYRLMNASMLAKLGNPTNERPDNKPSIKLLAAENKNTNKMLKVNNPFRSSLGSPFKSCSHDVTDSDELYNREIQTSLSNIVSKTKKKFDLIGFDCCLMSMVETAYAMRNVGLFMVASEELEPGEGWKYDDWLDPLVSNPGIGPDELSKLLVSSYRSTYRRVETWTTLAAIDLRGIEQVSNDISSLAKYLINNLKPNVELLKKTRGACKNYAPKHIRPNPFYHIDIAYFCDQLVKNSRDNQLRQLATNISKSSRAMVISNYCGEARRGNFGTYGLAIYFPPNGRAYTNDFYEKDGYKKNNKFYPVEFVQKHLWSDFLHAYFKENQ